MLLFRIDGPDAVHADAHDDGVDKIREQENHGRDGWRYIGQAVLPQFAPDRPIERAGNRESSRHDGLRTGVRLGRGLRCSVQWVTVEWATRHWATPCAGLG